MPKSDWSQFTPNLIIAFITVLLVGVIAYFKSNKFKKRFHQLLTKMTLALKWLISKWQLIVLYSFFVILGVVILRIYSDWRILAFSFICYVVGLLSWGLYIGRPISFSRSKATTKFLPIALFPGVGNAYLKKRYTNPPVGDVLLGNAHFQLGPDALIFDTNEQIRDCRPRNGGGREIDIQLPAPQCHVRSAYFLINSGNSKSIYARRDIGEIWLIFKDAPPIIVKLVLGKNIREWCPGNPGEFVREAPDPSITMGVWLGLNTHGVNAVMDCLQIPVHECMRNCFLEEIILVHNSLKLPPDEMGVHFSIFAVSLEVTQGI